MNSWRARARKKNNNIQPNSYLLALRKFGKLFRCLCTVGHFLLYSRLIAFVPLYFFLCVCWVKGENLWARHVINLSHIWTDNKYVVGGVGAVNVTWYRYAMRACACNYKEPSKIWQEIFFHTALQVVILSEFPDSLSLHLKIVSPCHGNVVLSYR